MKARKRVIEEVSFQLAPMIDMTFLLLVFFMVTTKISKEKTSIPVKLPIASNSAVPADVSNRDIITLDDKGELFIGDRPVTKKELQAWLKQRFIDYPPLQVYIRADQKTPAKKIKEIMRTASEAGAINVIFGSYKNE